MEWSIQFGPVAKPFIPPIIGSRYKLFVLLILTFQLCERRTTFFFFESSLPINQTRVSWKPDSHGCGVHFSLFKRSAFAHWTLPRIKRMIRNNDKLLSTRDIARMVHRTVPWKRYRERTRRKLSNRRNKKNETKKQRWRNSSPFNISSSTFGHPFCGNLFAAWKLGRKREREREREREKGKALKQFLITFPTLCFQRTESRSLCPYVDDEQNCFIRLSLHLPGFTATIPSYLLNF